MKIVIIGAGSMSFSASLFNSITRSPLLESCEWALCDIDPQALEVCDRLAQRLIKERGLKAKVKSAMDRREVLAGADVVTTTIAVGGNKAWNIDVEAPGRYGCIQTVGDTSGPGGLGRALRHIPEMVAIAEDMADLCPKAVLYNYTNPMTVLTRAVHKHTPIKCIGLCIGPELTWRYLADFLGLTQADTWAQVAGINHCHWILDFRRGTEDLRPWVNARLAQYKGDDKLITQLATEKPEEEIPHTDPFRGHFQTFSFALYEQFGYFPGPGDFHVSEFYPQLAQTPERASEMGLKNGFVAEMSDKQHPAFYETMRQQAYGEIPLREDMFGEQSYGEESQLTEILEAQQGTEAQRMFINIPNERVISNLPDEAVVEIPVLINSAGITPIHVGKLPEQLVPTLAKQSANLEVLIEAALKGSRDLAVQAFMNDPYCTDIVTGKQLVNELIDALISWLPKFAKK